MSTEPMADMREMYLAHSMFRREFGLLPALISGVGAADAKRAGVVAQHFELIHSSLHHHHEGEDRFVWPVLTARVPRVATPIVATMEAQHAGLDKVLADLTSGLGEWRSTADPVSGAALAEAAARLSALLAGHLAAEEEQAVPLIERYVTAAEWGQAVAAGAADVKPDELPLALGMMIYEGDPELIREIVGHMPPEIRPVIADLAAGQFAAYCERVHGTPAPAKSGEL